METEWIDMLAGGRREVLIISFYCATKMSPPGLVKDLSDIQSNQNLMRYTNKLIRGVVKHNPEAGLLIKYLGEFISMNCAPDMLSMRLFPNSKEISESFGAYDAARYRLPQFSLGDPSVSVVAVADGRTPRTAGTFAFRSKWTCYSVDPLLKGGKLRWAGIQRLHLVPDKIENFKLEAKRVILVAVHSHAILSRAVQSIHADELAVIAIPCCVPQTLAHPPDIEYQDRSIISPHRIIKIWNNINA